MGRDFLMTCCSSRQDGDMCKKGKFGSSRVEGAAVFRRPTQFVIVWSVHAVHGVFLTFLSGGIKVGLKKINNRNSVNRVTPSLALERRHWRYWRSASVGLRRYSSFGKSEPATTVPLPLRARQRHQMLGETFPILDGKL